MDARWLLGRASESGQGWLSTYILLHRGVLGPLFYSTEVVSDPYSILQRWSRTYIVFLLAIVQLPCTGHPTRSTFADYGTGTDTGL